MSWVDTELSHAFDQRRPMLRVEGELGWPWGAAVDLQSLPDRGLERAEKPELEDSRRYLGGATLGFARPGQIARVIGVRRW